MFTVILIMISGILIGYLLRDQRWISKPISIIVTWTIYLLLFLLGVKVGADEIVINNLGKIGFEALLLTIGAVSGSIVVSWITYIKFFKNNER